MDTPEWDRAYAVDGFVEQCIRDIRMLPSVLRLFVETAQSDQELAFVGTWHLENAYFSGLGQRALDALRECGLPDATQATVLEGFRL